MIANLSFDPYSLLMGLSLVVLLCYGLDFLGRSLRIPAVIFILAAGMVLCQGFAWLNLEIPNLQEILTLLGVLGLILIVLEGTLDLELSWQKTRILLRSLFLAGLGFVLTGWLIAMLLERWLHISYYESLLLATPFAVLSSAIAIPSVLHMGKGL